MDVEHEGGSTLNVAASSASPSDESKVSKPASLSLLLPGATQSTSSGVVTEDAAATDPVSLTTTAPIASTHGVPSSEVGSLSPSFGLSTSHDAGATSQASVARSYDVYIGVFGKEPLLVRYAKWMHAELEMNHAVACFSSYSDSNSSRDDIAKSVAKSASHGVVIVTRQSFGNPYTIEDLTVFLSRGNLVPVFFDVAPADCLVRDIVERLGEVWEVHGGELWTAYGGEEKRWSDAVEGLLTVEDRRVEAHQQNWRESIHEVAALVRNNKEIVTPVDVGQELPWPRNEYFAGREKELKAMEKLLFSDIDNAVAASSSKTVAQTLARGSDASSKAEAEEPESGRVSSYDGEEEGIHHHHHYSPKEIDQADHHSRGSRDFVSGSLRDRRAARRSYREHKRRDSADRRGESDRSPFSPTCVLTGIPGIGKSELAFEFAYRHLQKYHLVLWVGGESRYLRQNYLNLSSSLRIDVDVDMSVETPTQRVRTFDEQEACAVHKVRRELEKDTPFLLIIDNVNASRDSWDGRELRELLPRFGSATHVIITTRLPRVMHLDSLEVPFLSSFEALRLMRDGKRQSSSSSSGSSFSVHQIDKFKELETKLGRLPFGLAIVGRLIPEFKLKPSDLLAKMGAPTPTDQLREDAAAIFGGKPFLVKLLDVCFDLMCGSGAAITAVNNKSSMAMRMAYVGGWFAPNAPCPLSLVALAARKLAKELRGGNLQVQTQFVTSMLSCWLPGSQNARSDADAGAQLLTRLGLARASASARDNCLYFPDIIQVYSRMRGGVPAARSFVGAITKSGSVVQHFDHFWAAMYLVCRGFGSEAVSVVELQVPDLLLFTRGVVLPLALRAFNAFSRCTAALEVLRLSYVMLEVVEKSYVAQIRDPWDQPVCWARRGNSGRHQVDEYVWQDLTLLKAIVLETRAKLMLRGGQYDAGEELCRTCISIRTVMLGAEHPDTVAAQEMLSKFNNARTR